MDMLGKWVAAGWWAVVCIAVSGLAAQAEPIKVGERAPDLALPATTGGEIQLSDYRGEMVLVEFYHADWGPTCTANLEQRRDDYDQFEARGVTVLGISMNHIYSQTAFAESLGLPFPLLSDYPDGQTIQAFGVDYYEGEAMRLYARPSFFLVDEEGIVIGYWGQRPMNPDEILAPDPLISSGPILAAAEAHQSAD